MLPAIRNLWIAGLSREQVAALVDLLLYGDLDEAPEVFQPRSTRAVTGVTDDEALVRLAAVNTILYTTRMTYEELGL